MTTIASACCAVSLIAAVLVGAFDEVAGMELVGVAFAFGVVAVVVAALRPAPVTAGKIIRDNGSYRAWSARQREAK